MFDWRREATRLGVEPEFEGLLMTVLARVETMNAEDRSQYLRALSEIVARSGMVQ